MTREKALARGQIVKAWPVMMVTSAQVETLAVLVNALAPLSVVIPYVSTVMAVVVVSKQDMDS